MSSSLSAKKIFQSAVKSVQPEHLITTNLFRTGNVLQLDDEKHRLNHNVYVVGFGKAVYGMCRAVQNIVSEHVIGGALSVPHGLVRDISSTGKIQQVSTPGDDDKIIIYEGARHNQPDEDSLVAADHIRQICENANQENLVIALISGGGSALLPAPISPLTLQEKSETISMLAGRGANIQKLNVVRQHLSLLKGGRLAKVASPAKVWSFILSDIIADPIELIASGPTVSCTSKSSDALDIIKEYQVQSSVSPNVISVLETLTKKENKDVSCEAMSHVYNKVVGNNTVALNSACQEAERLGYKPIVLSHKLHGEAKFLGVCFAELSLLLCRNGNVKNQSLVNSLIGHGISASEINSFFNSLTSSMKENAKLCILSGGETTVTLPADHGLGGRNQEMVLSFAIKLRELVEGSNNCHFTNRSITFLSAGTDGQDGPTLSAGAVFTSGHVKTFDSSSAKDYLKHHDSYSYFAKTIKDSLVLTGLTGTNVMDIQVLIFEPNSQ